MEIPHLEWVRFAAPTQDAGSHYFSDGYLINNFFKKGRVYSRPFEHNELIISGSWQQ
jgi:hypothetical protein